MKNMPLISVIVPIYKVEKYLRQCIESIIEQTYSNIEIILVDDGSPDQCGLICDEYKTKDNRVVVIHKSNGGLSSARNAGLRIAKGQYIAFIDSDDFIERTMFEELLNLCLKYNVMMAACNYAVVTEKSTLKNEEDGRDNLLSSEKFFDKLLQEDNKIGMVAWNKLYHKSIFEKLPDPFPEGKLYEDLATMYQFVFSVTEVAWINKSLYMYRYMRPGAITSKKFNKDSELDRLLISKSMKEFVRKKAPSIYDNAVTFACIDEDLSVANAMIQSNAYNKELIKWVKNDLKKGKKSWLVADIRISKKMQLLICMCSFRMYAFFMKRTKYR